MRVGGVWVGWGLGDNSTGDFTVRNAKAFMRKKFPSYAGGLADTNAFDQQMLDAVWEMQRRYFESGRLHAPTGILDLDTQVVMGFKKAAPPVRPVLFTVEGHMSDMFQGPCAETARILESEGVCRWQPVGYNNTALPFDNASGQNELRRLLSDTVLLPPGTPWGMAIFSQGGIVGSKFFLEDVRPESGALHWRFKDFRGCLAHGNPYRENSVIADWVPDPPRPNTQGISDVRMTNTPANWKEVARHGDLYAENTVDDAGEDKTAVYKIVQNQWWGGPDSIFMQVFEIVQRPAQEVIAMIQAITSGVMFLANMTPHGGYDLGPGIEFMRSRLATAA